MADRNLFGGTPADVAENEAGVRVAGGVGLVWEGPEDTAEQMTDLVDVTGTPITQLVADERGVLAPFWGPPDGREALWVDFGVGRMKLTSCTIGERLKAHLEQFDPHSSKQYTDEQLTGYIPRRGARINTPAGEKWVAFQVPDLVDDRGDEGLVLALETAGSTPSGARLFTRLYNTGALHVEPNGAHVPLVIGQWEKASPNDTALSISKGRTNTPSVFRVRADGRIEAAGAVSAPNIGTARLFSGPVAPTNPKVGDVWVQYVA
ncbi:hypothetical protein ACMA1D_18075 [Streptomyces sp. 796.1]|uniref:hypothetical protein n=1 Tax=Streptomyces sp. 796.1 TaxID=3163029 RepID=UPI0039C9C097